MGGLAAGETAEHPETVEQPEGRAEPAQQAQRRSQAIHHDRACLRKAEDGRLDRGPWFRWREFDGAARVPRLRSQGGSSGVREGTGGYGQKGVVTRCWKINARLRTVCRKALVPGSTPGASTDFP